MISAVQAHEGATIFEWLADPRLRLIRPDQPAPDQPDIVVFPAKLSEFARAAPALPKRLAASLRSGPAIAVFDAAREGAPHHPKRTRLLHLFAQRLRVPVERCVYLTQDRGYAADYQAYCRVSGAEPMRVVTADHWIRRLLAYHADNGVPSFGHRRKQFKRRELAREKRFLSLNLTPRPTKVLFLLSLMRDGLWDQGFITFGGFDKLVGIKGRTLEAMRQGALAAPGFETLAAGLAPLLPRLEAMGRVLTGPRSDALTAAEFARDEHLFEYDRSWFSVVTETEMMGRPCRITEKTLKPLLNFHPMVLFGNPGSLELVRELGFRTFDGLIDERYDLEPDPRRRFEMAYGEVRRLCAMDEGQLKRLEKAAAETLAFNAEWGLVRLPRLGAERLDAALIDDILGLPRAAPAA